VVFVADDLAAWLVGLLAEQSRRRLTTVLLGTEQERAVRSAATVAVQQTAKDLRPDDDGQAEQVALVISQVFSDPVPDAPLTERQTILEALQAGITAHLAVLDDASLTGTGQSSADVLEIPGTVIADKLTGHLLGALRETPEPAGRSHRGTGTPRRARRRDRGRAGCPGAAGRGRRCSWRAPSCRSHR